MGSENSQRRGHHYEHIYVSDSAIVNLGDHIHARQLGEGGTEMEQQQALLKALAYEKMHTRRLQLQNSVPAFLDWIWSEQRTGPGFAAWLSGGKGNFWITGKPGSGKSTLMNFLAHHKKTAKLLSVHRPKKWLVLHFFFDFRSGTGIANSPDGMLRSLLSQLIKADIEIHRIVSKSVIGKEMLLEERPLSRMELLTLTKLSVVESGQNVCAFIDGLDEYQGQVSEILSLTTELCQEDSIICCLASRPEPYLELALQSLPSVKMQDYNARTIQEVVEKSMSSIASLIKPSILQGFSQQIVQQSQGVLVWAGFAVQEIVDGFLYQESLSEVEQRLHRFPAEMCDVYTRIFSSIDSRFKEEVALILHLIKFPDLRFTTKVLQEMLEHVHKIGALPSFPAEKMDNEMFQRRLRVRLRGLIDLIRTNDHNVVYVNLFHKSLGSFVSDTSWTENNMSLVIRDRYPDNFWLRICSEVAGNEMCKISGYKSLDEYTIEDLAPSTRLTELPATLPLLAEQRPSIRFMFRYFQRLEKATTTSSLLFSSLGLSILSIAQLQHQYGSYELGTECYCDLFQVNVTLTAKELAVMVSLSHRMYRYYEGAERSNPDLFTAHLRTHIVRHLIFQIAKDRYGDPRADVDTVTGTYCFDERHLPLRDVLSSILCKQGTLEIMQAARGFMAGTWHSDIELLRATWLGCVNKPWPHLYCDTIKEKVGPLFIWAVCATRSSRGGDEHERNLSLLQKLLDSGEDINGPCYSGGTILHAFLNMQRQDPEALCQWIPTLVKYGLDLNVRGPQSKGTILDLVYNIRWLSTMFSYDQTSYRRLFNVLKSCGAQHALFEGPPTLFDDFYIRDVDATVLVAFADPRRLALEVVGAFEIQSSL